MKLTLKDGTEAEFDFTAAKVASDRISRVIGNLDFVAPEAIDTQGLLVEIAALLTDISEALHMRKPGPSTEEVESLKAIAGYFESEDHCPNCGDKYPEERGGTCQGSDGKCGYFVTPKRIGVRYIDRLVEEHGQNGAEREDAHNTIAKTALDILAQHDSSNERAAERIVIAEKLADALIGKWHP